MPHLKNGTILRNTEGQIIEVCSLIAAGGQGEVYKVKIGSRTYALKWYFPPATPSQQKQAEEQLMALHKYLLTVSPPRSSVSLAYFNDSKQKEE